MTGLSSDYASAWAAFLAAEGVRVQQETLEWEWTRGRTDYVAFLIGISDDAVRGHIKAQIEEIKGIPGVEPYPERYWHITIKQVGFLVAEPSRPDEVSAAQVQEMAEAARPVIESVRAFEVTAGPPNAFPEVVFTEAHDRGEVRLLNKALLGLPHLPAYPVDGDVFLPHISIARFTSGEGIPSLKEVLSRLRSQSSGPSFTVREVLLVQAHLAAEAPTFDLLALYKLRE